MIFGTENSIQLARFRAVALAEDTLLCKVEPHGSATFFNQRGNEYRGWFLRRSCELQNTR